MQIVSLKCQILFSRKNKENIISVSSAEFPHSMVSVNISMVKRLDVQILNVIMISITLRGIDMLTRGNSNKIVLPPF